MMDQANRTLWVGNLEPRVTEELLFELFLQAGPLQHVNIAKDKEGKQRNFAFVEFKHDESVPYTMQLMGGLPLFGRPLLLKFRSGSKHESALQPPMGPGMPSPLVGLPNMPSPGFHGGNGGMGLLGPPPVHMQQTAGGMTPRMHRSASSPGGMSRMGQNFHGGGQNFQGTPGMPSGMPMIQAQSGIGLPPGTPFSQGAALQGMSMPERRDQSRDSPPQVMPRDRSGGQFSSAPNISPRNSYDSPEMRGADIWDQSGRVSERSRDDGRDRNRSRHDNDYSPHFDRDRSHDFERQRSYGHGDRGDFPGRDSPVDQRPGHYSTALQQGPDHDFRGDPSGTFDRHERREDRLGRSMSFDNEGDKNSPYGFEKDGSKDVRRGSHDSRGYRFGGNRKEDGDSSYDQEHRGRDRSRDQGRYRDRSHGRHDQNRRGYNDGRSSRRNYHSGR